MEHVQPARKPPPSFMEKLPNSHLFKIQDRFDGRYIGDYGADWYSFLSRNDENARWTRGSNGLRSEFHYIKYEVESFQKRVFPFLKGARTFIDVGCGGGDKLAIVKAKKPSLRVFGVEHDPAMAIWAQATTGAEQVFCRDAFSLDYGLYDVIYAYWPIADRKIMTHLVDHILRTMHKKAKFVLVGFEMSSGDPRRKRLATV